MGSRFAFDQGTSSIGWAIFETEEKKIDGRPRTVPVRLVDMGVRIFPDGRDPQTGDSLGKLRRDPKSARRLRDRKLQRRKWLLRLLEDSDLLPPAGPERDALFAGDVGGTEDGNPLYNLRARAASEKVSLHELGRVLWLLNQRRGFKSNRKADAGGDDDPGKIAAGGQALRTEMEERGYRTLGQFLADRQRASDPNHREPVRVRPNGKDAERMYDFYPQRAMLEEEFAIIWTEQARHHPTLTDELKDRIERAIFTQRPLKPVLPGRCTFYPDEYRCPRSREIAQEFTVLTQLANMRIDAGDGERSLFAEERDALAEPLLAGKKLTWKQVRKSLGIGAGPKINFEESGESHLIFNALPGRFDAVTAGKHKREDLFEGGWMSLPAARRTEIIETLDPAPAPGTRDVIVPPDSKIAEWAEDHLGLSPENAVRLSRTSLPDGHLSLSGRALREVLPHLRAPTEEGMVRTYAAAMDAAGLDHSDIGEGGKYARLPKYNHMPEMERFVGFGTHDPDDLPDHADKFYGKIANPTVHIGLNQLRRLINELVDRYGAPDEIVIEVARDLKLSRKQKEARERLKQENKKANDRRREEMTKIGEIEEGQRKIRDRLLRMRMWEELGPNPNDRVCPFTGEPISLTMLFSEAVEVEHILPYSRTLDDSPSNKTVALRSANRLKKNLSPEEAAAQHPDKFDLEAMKERTRRMPPNKKWRFEAGAMDRYEGERNFADRQLHAAGHLAKVARTYLRMLKDKGGDEPDVWVTTGQLTAKLRHQWGLNLGDHNRKNRGDHRHHAVDAAVIGVIDRSLVQRVATVSGREEVRGTDVDRLITGLSEPYDGYIDEVRDRAQGLLISPRADHGRIDPARPQETSGQLHDATYYGHAEGEALGNVTYRKNVADLSANEIARIRDAHWREKILEATEGLSGKELTSALKAFSNGTYRNAAGKTYPHPRHVRLVKAQSDVVPITDKQGQPYKWVRPAENVWMDIVELPDGKWRGHSIDIYAANTGQGRGWEDAYPDARFIMRLYKGDTVQLFDPDGENRVKKVVRIEPSAGRVRLVPVNEGGEYQKRHDDPDDDFRWDLATISKLKDRRARRVRFTHAGRMKTVPHGKI